MRRSPTSWVLLATALLAASLLVEACSIERDYKRLSFFFDGVPDPDAPPLPAMAPGQLRPEEYASLTNEQRAALLARKVAVPEISYHPPAREKRCGECHEEAPGGSAGGFPIGIPELLLPPEQLCLKCHEVPDATYVHGPAGLGMCSFCHLPHQSLYPHLLRREKPSELCSICHTGDTFVTSVEHEAYGDQSCTSCHDPHASERPALLRPEERPEAPQEEPDAEHDPSAGGSEG